MTPEQSPVLAFPAWLYGTTAAILRKAEAEGRWWAREYLETGAFPSPGGCARCSPARCW